MQIIAVDTSRHSLALQMQAGGYLRKPVTAESLQLAAGLPPGTIEEGKDI